MNEAKEKSEQAREAAAIRRRWITLGELLAVVAVLISGLTLWNSYSERSASEAARAEEKQEQAKVSRTLLLQAKTNGKSLQLSPHDPNQVIQSQTILFPSALDISAIDTLIEPRIEAEWIRPAARNAREASPKQPKSSGDSRLPVAITTRFVSGGETITDIAIYDVGYKFEEGGLLGGSEVELRGLSLIERIKGDRAKTRLDSVWKGRQPLAAAGEQDPKS
ncbi:hypothetical protein [Sphingosinicella rhizophila]|uniref:Uncharacterized protein n=1 Tax=Sphingosinicella rhizophila TaxID=3050082 RepID=A0ABU3Q372_9SPHN|nr:hypothetical protein [Sphingosinicella sp. GR2756]MDT9597722.1 hypothetical protein [Sphingosinicella sp. GR2756]